MKKEFTEQEIQNQIKIEKRAYRREYYQTQKQQLKKHQDRYWRNRAKKTLEANSNQEE